MRKYISIVEALNEATPVQPVKPLKPGDPRNNAQNTTAPAPNGQQQQNTAPQAPVSRQQQGRNTTLPPAQNTPDGAQPTNPNAMANQQRPGQPVDPNADMDDPNAKVDPDAPVDPNAPTDPNAKVDPDVDDGTDPVFNKGMTAGDKAKKFLQGKGVIESVQDANAHRKILLALDNEHSVYSIAPEKNIGMYGGYSFSCGMADLRSGAIMELHTYEKYSREDFDISSVFHSSIMRFYNDEAVVFFMEPDGRFLIDSLHPDPSVGPFLRIKLERLIRAQLG